MAVPPNVEPTRARARRLVVVTLRTLAVDAGLLLVYSFAPLDRPLDGVTWAIFGGGLGLFAGLVAWQVREILRSDTPRLQAAQALAVGLPLLLLVFAGSYTVIATNDVAAFTESLTRTDALYFTVTVFATVGFGDIAPRTDVARILTTVQMIVGLLAVGIVARILFGAVAVAEQRRDREPPSPPG